MDISVVFLFFSLFSAVEATSFDCPTVTWSYSSPLTSYTSEETGTAGYLMTSPEYHVPDACSCGVLHKWHFYAVSGGAIQLQVWSRESESIYTLIGENYFTIPASAVGEEIEFVVPIKDRITVRNNYLIGWFSTGSSKIGYKDGSNDYPDELIKDTNVPELLPGESYDWDAGTGMPQTGKVYAIGASATENTAPGFTNLPRTVRIFRTWAANAHIYTVTADDIDENDVSSLIITNDAVPVDYFPVSGTTVRLGQATPAEGSYNIAFTVSDQCGNTGTGTLTIIVDNWAPTLVNLPSFATITENYDHEEALYTIIFSDADDNTLTVSYTINPSTTNIILKNYGFDAANKSVVTVAGASYSYPTSQKYVIDVTFSDGTSTTDPGYFLVYVTKNDPPVFTNLNNAVHVNVSYISTAIGDVIYNVSATDAENDPLTFSIACDPVSPCPFQINSDGIITATADFIRTYVTGFDIVVLVTDGTTSITSKTLTVLVKDINDIPQISNVPLTRPLVVFEDTPLGTTVYTVSYNDRDTTDVHLTQATYSPISAANYFQMGSTNGVLTTAVNLLDYEKFWDDEGSNVVTVNVTVSDGQHWDSATLDLLIGNVNEAPTFHQTKYTLEPPEEGTAGLSAGATGFVVYDPDSLVAALAETHTYTWNCGVYSRYFIMDYNSGAITFATTFDYDTANFTSPYSCNVTVTDKAGLTGTTVLEIDVHDVNDNDPVFAQDEDYLVFQVPNLAVSRFVGQVRATDADRSSPNNDIYYSFIQNPFLEGFLYINEFGNIYVNESWEKPEFDYGMMYELVVLAENVNDTTGTKRTATATVSLILPGTTTVTTTTTDRPAYFIEDDTRNVAWVAVASSLVLTLLIIACCMILAYTVQTKRYRWCLPSIRKKLLGLKKMTEKQKRQYYREILLQEELERSSSDSDQGWLDPLHDEDLDDDLETAPPVWTKLNFSKPGSAASGSTGVPAAARYHEPKPQSKNVLSRKMEKSQTGAPKIWS